MTVASVKSPLPLLLVGCGNMGGALLAGWLADGISADGVHIVSPSQMPGRLANGCHAYSSAGQVPEDLCPAVVVLAIKPQKMDEVLPSYVGLAASALVISIAAGKDIAYLQGMFGADSRVVRVMPNIPAAVGRGASSLFAASTVSQDDRALSIRLMRAVGEAVWLQTESQMAAATAIAGSGPAYVFLLIEAMTAAGVAHGLSRDIARKLAHVTVCGAGELAWQSAADAASLRQDVTSPGGVTAEALRVLMRDEGGLQDLMHEAFTANIHRSRVLAQNTS